MCGLSATSVCHRIIKQLVKSFNAATTNTAANTVYASVLNCISATVRCNQQTVTTATPVNTTKVGKHKGKRNGAAVGRTLSKFYTATAGRWAGYCWVRTIGLWAQVAFVRLLRKLSARHLVAVACHQISLLLLYLFLLLYLWLVMRSYYSDNNYCCHSNLWLLRCLFDCCGIVIVCCLLVVCWLYGHSVTHGYTATHVPYGCGTFAFAFCCLQFSALTIAAVVVVSLLPLFSRCCCSFANFFLVVCALYCWLRSLLFVMQSLTKLWWYMAAVQRRRSVVAIHFLLPHLAHWMLQLQDKHFGNTNVRWRVIPTKSIQGLSMFGKCSVYYSTKLQFTS